MASTAIETTAGLDPMPRPIWTKARDNDRRPWTAEEGRAIIDLCSLGICAGQGALKRALPNRRYGDILERRAALMEAGLLRIPAPL